MNKLIILLSILSINCGAYMVSDNQPQTPGRHRRYVAQDYAQGAANGLDAWLEAQGYYSKEQVTTCNTVGFTTQCVTK